MAAHGLVGKAEGVEDRKDISQEAVEHLGKRATAAELSHTGRNESEALNLTRRPHPMGLKGEGR